MNSAVIIALFLNYFFSITYMTQEKMLEDVLEIVSYIKDNAVTKEEFEERMSGLEERMGGLEGRMGNLETRMTKAEALMVTKDYLDEKLADLQGNLTVLMRKEDSKLRALIKILTEKNVLNDQERVRILSMEPFPELMI